MKSEPFGIWLGIVVLDCLLAAHWLGIHAPLSDDLSMMAYSHAWSWDWLTKGLADYFIVYPEYYGPQSNFIRPVSNILYWVFSALFTADAPFLANRAQLIVLTFGMHAAIASTVFMITHRMSGSLLIGRLSALSCFLIPTFWTTPTPTYSSFVFDGLSILFCLLAFHATSRQQIVATGIFLGLALLTKEISFPIVLAFGVFFLLNRKWVSCLAPILAFAIWSALRLNGFGLHAEGVYVFSTESVALSEFLFEKIRNALSMPFGPVFYEDVLTESGLHLINRSGLLLIINIAIYSAILAMSVRVIAREITRTHGSRILAVSNYVAQNPLPVLAGIAAFFSFLFDAYIGANYRYAFNFLPFLFIAMSAVPRIHVIRILFGVFVLGSAIASGPALMRFQTGSEFELYRYRIVRDLFTELRKHRAASPIVILNDFVLGYANPTALNVLLPSTAVITRGTSLYLDSCPLDQIKTIRTHVEKLDGSMRISADLPQCARFTFESSPKLANFISGNQILRNETIRYEFQPSVTSGSTALAGWSGRDLTAILKNSDALYFDFEKDAWVYVEAD